MRVLFLDLDTLRPDHLGCYGYVRNTSPNIDAIAKDAVRFNRYYCSDAPCLPSRAALTTGRFGIHNGAVGHGGTAGDLKLYGSKRGFNDPGLEHSFFNIFRKAGFHTASISTFAERHSSYWFLSGLNESYNCGDRGIESAERVMPTVRDWLARNADKDNWMLHLHFWDPHTPYRAPADYGNPFADQPYPDWITEEEFQKHLQHVGPHSVNEISMYTSDENPQFPRQPGSLKERADLRRLFDGYDCGIAYMDAMIGEITTFLKEKGIYDDTAIIISSDHGEDMGELGVYAEHGLADECTTHIPMIIKWPGVAPGTDDGLHYNIDLLPTLADLLGVKKYPLWDGESYRDALLGQAEGGRAFLVVSQQAHVCQRAVITDEWLYIMTYHGGLHLFDREMLFNLREDIHQTKNLAAERPEVVAEMAHRLHSWHSEMMAGNADGIDPMYTVLTEGGPYHARGHATAYAERLKQTGRSAYFAEYWKLFGGTAVNG